ncbi:MAG: Fur family transcriptional regulator [Longimicrobiales bacterium]
MKLSHSARRPSPGVTRDQDDWEGSGSTPQAEHRLKEALDRGGHRVTEQRAAVYRFLQSTDSHPTAEDVLVGVRENLPRVSLATVYKSLETFVGSGLARKLTYSDGSSRYDGRTDPHHHARCTVCERVRDVPGELPLEQVADLDPSHPFLVTGYRLELTGVCGDCA